MLFFPSVQFANLYSLLFLYPVCFTKRCKSSDEVYFCCNIKYIQIVYFVLHWSLVSAYIVVDAFLIKMNGKVYGVPSDEEATAIRAADIAPTTE